MELKVGDFGLAARLEFEGERRRTVCGTPNYIAPEILDGKMGHSYEVDIWSLGVIMYTLLIGKPPYETQDVKQTYKKIKMNQYTFPEGILISEYAKNLIIAILQLDPLKRPNLDELLMHDFFHQGNSIPKLLPTSTLACPPSITYIRSFMPDANMNGFVSKAGVYNNDVVQNTASSIYQSRDNNNYNNFMMSNVVRDIGKGGILNTNAQPYIPKRTITNQNMGQNEASSQLNQESIPNEVTVKKWVDYSSKYGLGYLLSNNIVGVYFNDSSKIILDSAGVSFNYIERRISDRQEEIYTHTLKEYPKELMKKVTLLNHFKNYLEGDVKEGSGVNEVLASSVGVAASNSNVTNVNNQTVEPVSVITSSGQQLSSSLGRNFTYVKKWMRTRHAILFRLSNKIVQVCFQDHTEIILSSEVRAVTYVNKTGQRSTYALANALESSNLEMVKRLKYTKEVLTHMLNLNTQMQTKLDAGFNVSAPITNTDVNNNNLAPNVNQPQPIITIPVKVPSGKNLLNNNEIDKENMNPNNMYSYNNRDNNVNVN